MNKYDKKMYTQTKVSKIRIINFNNIPCIQGRMTIRVPDTWTSIERFVRDKYKAHESQLINVRFIFSAKYLHLR